MNSFDDAWHLFDIYWLRGSFFDLRFSVSRIQSALAQNLGECRDAARKCSSVSVQHETCLTVGGGNRSVWGQAGRETGSPDPSVVIIFQEGVKMSRCMSSFLHALAKKRWSFFTIFSQYFHNIFTIFSQ